MAKELQLQLNSAVAKKEANVKSVCQSLKKKLQEKHPELGIANELKTINNGFQITCSGWTFDVVRYQKWVRLDILKAGEKQAKFFKTDAPEVRDVVILFMSKIDEALAKAATEQPVEQTAEPKTVTPLKWVSDTGMNGTSGWYAYLEQPDGSQKTLAHVSTCGMIYWESDDIAQLDKIKVNEKASRIYHEWMQGYENANDEEKENTYIAPNLTTADSFAMTRDRKKVEQREKQPDKYKKFPTRAEWLETWKNEMFELLKQDGYKYPSDVSTNSNRKGERKVKTLRLDSSKIDREGYPSPFYPDSELLMPVDTDEVLEALAETSKRDKDTGMLVVHFSEDINEDTKMPYLAYVQPAGYEDNTKIENGDASAIVYVKYLDGDYNESKEIKMPVAEVANYLDSVKTTPVKGNSSRKTYLRRKLDALNSAKLPVGATSKSETDTEFMNDVDSILSLSTGDTIDVDAAYLAYNPETKELILSDEGENTLDSGYAVIGKFTPDKDALAQIAGKEPELESEDDEFGDDDMPADEGAEMPEDENAEMPARDSHVPAPEDEESEGGIFQ